MRTRLLRAPGLERSLSSHPRNLIIYGSTESQIVPTDVEATKPRSLPRALAGGSVSPAGRGYYAFNGHVAAADVAGRRQWENDATSVLRYSSRPEISLLRASTRSADGDLGQARASESRFKLDETCSTTIPITPMVIFKPAIQFEPGIPTESCSQG